MINIKDDCLCCGCGVCVNVCPKQCISNYINEEGFSYPIVDKSVCIDCHLCEKVCPWLHQNIPVENIDVKVFQNEDCEILNESSSGGAFYILAKSILDDGGVVFGVKMDSHNRAVHSQAESEEELKALMGSKYIQSDMGKVMKECREQLKAGRKVLFSGTPCQIAGLMRFLGKDWDNLVTIDVICHGVPSPGIWNRFAKETCIEKNANIKFRDKLIGWKDYCMSYNYDGQRQYIPSNKNAYLKGFVGNLFLRESCYDCKVKGFSSGSDITLGDAWGIGELGVTDDRGISLLIANTEKGKKLVSSMRQLDITVDREFILKHNPSAFTSVRKNRKRKKFYKKIQEGYTVAEAVEICFPPASYFDKIIWSLGKRMRKYGIIK